jgi:integrase
MKKFLTEWENFSCSSGNMGILRTFLDRWKNLQTQKAKFTAIRVFERWRKSTWIYECKFKFPPVPHPPILTEEEMLRIIENLDFKTENQRDRLIIQLLFYTGARAGAILGLRAKDVDTNNQVLTVTTKGGVKGQIIYPKELTIVLEKYIKERCEKPDSPLFYSTKTGKQLDVKVFSHRYKKHAEKANIKHRVWTHGIRHAAATRMVEHCGDITAVQRQLQHQSITTTMKYVQIGLEQARKAVFV